MTLEFERPPIGTFLERLTRWTQVRNQPFDARNLIGVYFFFQFRSEKTRPMDADRRMIDLFIDHLFFFRLRPACTGAIAANVPLRPTAVFAWHRLEWKFK